MACFYHDLYVNVLGVLEVDDTLNCTYEYLNLRCPGSSDIVETQFDEKLWENQAALTTFQLSDLPALGSQISATQLFIQHRVQANTQ